MSRNELRLLLPALLLATSSALAQGPVVPAATAPSPKLVATINSDPVMSEQLTRNLYLIAGPRVLSEMINVFAAREACRLSNITINIDTAALAERDRLITRLIANIVPPPPAAPTNAEKEAMLQNFAASQGLSAVELGWQFEQAGYLRALGKAQRTPDGKPAALISPIDLNDEFQREFGDRANVRVYIFDDEKSAVEFSTAADKAKGSFTTLADDKKIPWRGVVIPTDPSVTFTPAKFQAAVRQLKDGDSSAVTTLDSPDGKEKKYVILYIEKALKGKLSAAEAAVQKARINTVMQEAAEIDIGQQVVNKLQQVDHRINVNILDPELAAQIKIQSATQPATATAPK